MSASRTCRQRPCDVHCARDPAQHEDSTRVAARRLRRAARRHVAAGGARGGETTGTGRAGDVAGAGRRAVDPATAAAVSGTVDGAGALAAAHSEVAATHRRARDRALRGSAAVERTARTRADAVNRTGEGAARGAEEAAVRAGAVDRARARGGAVDPCHARHRSLAGDVTREPGRAGDVEQLVAEDIADAVGATLVTDRRANERVGRDGIEARESISGAGAIGRDTVAATVIDGVVPDPATGGGHHQNDQGAVHGPAYSRDAAGGESRG